MKCLAEYVDAYEPKMVVALKNNYTFYGRYRNGTESLESIKGHTVLHASYDNNDVLIVVLDVMD